MKIFKLFLFHSIFLLLFSSMLTTKASTSTPQTHNFELHSSAFISDVHDVLVKNYKPAAASEPKFLPFVPTSIQKYVLDKIPARAQKAWPHFRQMTSGEKLKFLGKTAKYYLFCGLRSKIMPSKYPARCYESVALEDQDNSPNYTKSAIAMMNQDQVINGNIALLNKFKDAGAYVAICTNLGPESTKFVNQANQNFLDKLCTNPSDSNSSPAIWTPNGQTNFIKKHYPQSQAYLSLLERIAACKPDTKTIVVLDDKSTNLAAAQAALSRLQQQEPPVLASAKIVPIEIKHPDTFVSTVEKALNITKF